MAAQVAAAGRSRSRSPRRLEVADELSDVDGFSAEELFGDCKKRSSYTFDDLICLPGHIDFGVHEVCLDSKFTRNIQLRVPLVSSPMNTVTEEQMAIAMALQGGIGVIHRNMTIEEQCQKVRRVKSHVIGFIATPMCVTPDATVASVSKLCAEWGFSGMPVTRDGKVGTELLGIATRRDIDFLDGSASEVAVSSVMVKRADLVTALEGIDLPSAKAALFESKQDYLPVTSKADELVALIAREDMMVEKDFPLETKCANGRLAVAASVGVQAEDKDRIRALVTAGVDAIVIDSSQGDNTQQHDLVTWAKQEFSALDVIGGNVATPSQAKRLIASGVDGLRVGMGIGSLSTVQDVRACGRAQASAVYSISRVARAHGIPVIADGGLDGPGKMLKAFAMGASSAMCGSLFAGCEESPGVYFFNGGCRVKRYQGLGAVDSIPSDDRRSTPSSIRSVKVAHGVSGSVVDRGSLAEFMSYLVQSMKHGMQDAGAKSIDHLNKMVHEGQLRFEIRSPAAQREGGVHGLHSYEKTLFAAAK